MGNFLFLFAMLFASMSYAVSTPAPAPISTYSDGGNVAVVVVEPAIMKAAPNPAVGVPTTFTLNEPDGVINSIEVFTLAGVNVLTQACGTSECSADLASLPVGLYSLKITVGGVIYTSTLIVQRP
ncbi:MAG: T9SS type A sorting domain-containing protein [Bacteroidia bacterium]